MRSLLERRTRTVAAAAGLALLLGLTLFALGRMGLHPLGELAASVRGMGVSLGHSVLKVAVPGDDALASGPAESADDDAHLGPGPWATTEQDDGDTVPSAEESRSSVAEEPPPSEDPPGAQPERRRSILHIVRPPERLLGAPSGSTVRGGTQQAADEVEADATDTPGDGRVDASSGAQQPGAGDGDGVGDVDEAGESLLETVGGTLGGGSLGGRLP